MRPYVCVYCIFLNGRRGLLKKTMGCFEVENLQCAAIYYNRTVFIVLDLEASKNLFTVHSHHNNLPQSIFNRKWTFCTDKKNNYWIKVSLQEP